MQVVGVAVNEKSPEREAPGRQFTEPLKIVCQLGDWQPAINRSTCQGVDEQVVGAGRHPPQFSAGKGCRHRECQQRYRCEKEVSHFYHPIIRGFCGSTDLEVVAVVGQECITSGRNR